MRHRNDLLPTLRRVALLPDGAGVADGELLDQYLQTRDETAFEILVRRHGPMVLAVCRRLLRNESDAEDAFQATFLVLVHKARSIVPRALVGNWLYGVARHTALKAQTMNRKRRVKEQHAGTLPRPVSVNDDWQQTQAVLDEELSRLPDKYRVPIVLCDLEGRALREAASQLGWPMGTIAGRLSRARTLLAKRLARRGITLSAGALAAVAGQGTAGVPSPLVASTIQAAALTAAGKAAGSVAVAALTKGVLKAMFLSKLKLTRGLILAVVFLGTLATFGGFAGTDTSNDKLAPATLSDGHRQPPKKEDPPQTKTESKPQTKQILDIIKPGDRLHIFVVNIFPDQPINGVFQVEPSGKVALGPSYGRVELIGLDVEGAEVRVRDFLSKIIRDPKVSLTRHLSSDTSERERALEQRVRQLEQEVSALRAAVDELKKK